MDYAKIIRGVIEEHKISPIDMRDIGDAAGEYAYLRSLEDSYIRTVRDVDCLYKNDRESRRILEIGSFLGAVSISLKKLGYSVSASDIPEYIESSSLRKLYEKNGIPFDGVNLKHSKLPYGSDTFDAVILCEVLEHLNFNPLPVLMEINRVLKKNGCIYLAMPNQARIGNRLKLLMGKSIHNPTRDFFAQLDRNDNMMVGLHWREYTLTETVWMLEKMGFEISSKYYFAEKTPPGSILLMLLKKVLYAFPAFRPCQVVIARKVETPVHDFWRTDANS
jgi:SAM-dependent methyltransferase